MRITSLASGFVFAAVVVLVTTAWADDKKADSPRRGRPEHGKASGSRGPGHHHGHHGFHRPGGGPEMVHRFLEGKGKEELGLSDDQVKKLKEVFAGVREQMKSGRPDMEELRKLSPEERKERFTKMREAMQQRHEKVKAKVQSILDEDQQKKLREVMSKMRARGPAAGRRPGPPQRGGPPHRGRPGMRPGGPQMGPPPGGAPLAMLTSPRVREHLDLSDEQVAKLKKIGEGAREQGEKTRKAIHAKVKDVLTEEQVKKLEEIRKRIGQHRGPGGPPRCPAQCKERKGPEGRPSPGRGERGEKRPERRRPADGDKK